MHVVQNLWAGDHLSCTFKRFADMLSVDGLQMCLDNLHCLLRCLVLSKINIANTPPIPITCLKYFMVSLLVSNFCRAYSCLNCVTIATYISRKFVKSFSTWYMKLLFWNLKVTPEYDQDWSKHVGVTSDCVKSVIVTLVYLLFYCVNVFRVRS